MTDLDPESMQILELARQARTPSEEDKARIGRRLALAVGVSATATAASSSSSATVSAAHAEASAGLVKVASGAVAKWIGGGALLATALVGYVTLSGPSVATPSVVPPVVRAREPARAEAQPQDPVLQQEPELTPRRAAHPRQPTREAALSAELGLLHRAQAAWRARQPKDALSLLHEHRARYPHSQLTLERDALQALTLCELGRTDEATRIARSVIARAPHSPLRASLEQSCALK